MPVAILLIRTFLDGGMKELLKAKISLFACELEQLDLSGVFDVKQIALKNISIVAVHAEADMTTEIRRHLTREFLFPKGVQPLVVGLQIFVDFSRSILFVFF